MSIIYYCCPVKVNRKLCISLSFDIAAVLIIQRLGFQFQTVSIIECTYFDKKRPITTDNPKNYKVKSFLTNTGIPQKVLPDSNNYLLPLQHLKSHE